MLHWVSHCTKNKIQLPFSVLQGLTRCGPGVIWPHLSLSPLLILLQSHQLLVVPQICQAYSCLRDFTFAVPSTWNDHLPDLCMAHSVPTSRSLLKYHPSQKDVLIYNSHPFDPVYFFFIALRILWSYRFVCLLSVSSARLWERIWLSCPLLDIQHSGLRPITW